jgi:cytochrome c
MKKKVRLLTIIISGSIVLYACGGNQKESSDSGSSTNKASSEKVDDGKGIGKFTSVELGPIDAEMAKRGEAIFVSKCAACHKTTADKVVGPGLKGVTEIRKPEWIMNMITNPEEMTKKDPTAIALFEEHLIQMTFQNVSDEDTRDILEYLRQNDSTN